MRKIHPRKSVAAGENPEVQRTHPPSAARDTPQTPPAPESAIGKNPRKFLCRENINTGIQILSLAVTACGLILVMQQMQQQERALVETRTQFQEQLKRDDEVEARRIAFSLDFLETRPIPPVGASPLYAVVEFTLINSSDSVATETSLSLPANAYFIQKNGSSYSASPPTAGSSIMNDTQHRQLGVLAPHSEKKFLLAIPPRYDPALKNYVIGQQNSDFLELFTLGFTDSHDNKWIFDGTRARRA